MLRDVRMKEAGTESRDTEMQHSPEIPSPLSAQSELFSALFNAWKTSIVLKDRQ
jgi:hypothetical protein